MSNFSSLLSAHKFTAFYDSSIDFQQEKHKIKIPVIEFLRIPHQFHKKQERKG